MGAAIAAHLANAGVTVTLLDIVPEGTRGKDKTVRNKIVADGWDRCLKAKPANLMSSELKTLVSLGNLEDDLGVVREADWVIEAVVENLQVKRDLMARIDALRKELGIVSTNTSGIPVQEIARRQVQRIYQAFPWNSLFQPSPISKTPGGHPDCGHGSGSYQTNLTFWREQTRQRCRGLQGYT